ncbi:MAG: alpha/beta hydrolase [Clostridia bacterium]|nr:alpha/beta hydrolase [Clostridia bacterium]
MVYWGKGGVAVFGVREGTVKAGDKQMDYVTFGRGNRPLVMLQGLNTRGLRGSGVMLALMYRLFAKEYRVWFFDRRQQLPEGVTVRMLAEDVADAMDALGIAGADVLGVSQGGMIAQYLAIERPDLVRRLVLALTLSRTNGVVEQVVNGWIDMTQAGDRLALTRDMAEKMYSPAYLKRYRPLLPLWARLQWPRDPSRFVALARACLTCDTYNALDRITCPVMVIGAEHDLVVTGEASAEMAERLGGSLHMYAGLGHAAYYEEAADFNRRVYDFFQA